MPNGQVTNSDNTGEPSQADGPAPVCPSLLLSLSLCLSLSVLSLSPSLIYNNGNYLGTPHPSSRLSLKPHQQGEGGPPPLKLETACTTRKDLVPMLPPLH
jgi:hypothetical protein